MIENTDAEQIERLNARVAELLRDLQSAGDPSLALHQALDAARSQLVNAERRFESIRLILIKHLDEPERSAFWLAVEGRNAIKETGK